MNDPTTPIYFTPPKSKRTAVIVLSILLAISVLFSLILLIALAASSGTTASDAFSGELPSGEEYVAVLHIEGTISESDTTSLLYASDGMYNHAYILGAIEAVTEDENNKGILLYAEIES